MTGMSIFSARIFCSTSMPFMPGIFQSSSTRSASDFCSRWRIAVSPSPKASVEKPASVRLVLSDSRNRSSSSMTRMRPRDDSTSAWCIGLGRQNAAYTLFRHCHLRSVAVDPAIFERVQRRRLHVGIKEYLKGTAWRRKCPHQRDLALADLGGRAEQLFDRRRIKPDQARGIDLGKLLWGLLRLCDLVGDGLRLRQLRRNGRWRRDRRCDDGRRRLGIARKPILDVAKRGASAEREACSQDKKERRAWAHRDGKVRRPGTLDHRETLRVGIEARHARLSDEGAELECEAYRPTPPRLNAANSRIACLVAAKED